MNSRMLLTPLACVLSALEAGRLAVLRSEQIDRQARVDAGELKLQQAVGEAAAVVTDLGQFSNEPLEQVRLIEEGGALRQPTLLYVSAWAASFGSSPFTGFGRVMLARTPLQGVDLVHAGVQGGIWTAAALAVLLPTALAWLLSTLFLRLLGHYVERVHRVAEGISVLPLPRRLPAEQARLDEVVQALISRLPGQASCAGEPKGCPPAPHKPRDPYANERRHPTESGAGTHRAATRGGALLDDIGHAYLYRPTRSKVVKDCLSPAVWTQLARKP